MLRFVNTVRYQITRTLSRSHTTDALKLLYSLRCFILYTASRKRAQQSPSTAAIYTFIRNTLAHYATLPGDGTCEAQEGGRKDGKEGRQEGAFRVVRGRISMC